jgi:unsaturated chondroitin disaccharide hydrolase
MKLRFLLPLAGGLLAAAPTTPTVDVPTAMRMAGAQLELADKARTTTTRQPFTLNPDGSLKDREAAWWTSGFYPGSLWYAYEYSKKPLDRQLAEKWTAALQQEQYNKSTHDLGFMLYCSYGSGYRLTKNPAYRAVLIEGARSLASRFDPKVGLIKSWDNHEGYQYPVIIDNMMNLEFLFWASKATGDKQFYNIAVTHADNTLKHHFRPDYSSYHVVCYAPDGTVLRKKTAQGYSDSSACYTVCYRETKNPAYLAQAEHIADYYLNHPNLPADKIPYWDFNAPDIPAAKRDASAGAVAASGLLELSQYSKAHGPRYFRAAEQMLSSLSSSAYRAAVGQNHNFVLRHSVGHLPAQAEVDVPLVYADYYYIEGLLRYDKRRAGKLI